APAPPAVYPLSLHDALPIWRSRRLHRRGRLRRLVRGPDQHDRPHLHRRPPGDRARRRRAGPQARSRAAGVLRPRHGHRPGRRHPPPPPPRPPHPPPPHPPPPPPPPLLAPHHTTRRRCPPRPPHA